MMQLAIQRALHTADMHAELACAFKLMTLSLGNALCDILAPVSLDHV